MEFIYREVTIQISNLLMKRNRNKCLVRERERRLTYGIKLQQCLDLLLAKVNAMLGTTCLKGHCIIFNQNLFLLQISIVHHPLLLA